MANISSHWIIQSLMVWKFVWHIADVDMKWRSSTLELTAEAKIYKRSGKNILGFGKVGFEFGQQIQSDIPLQTWHSSLTGKFSSKSEETKLNSFLSKSIESEAVLQKSHTNAQ